MKMVPLQTQFDGFQYLLNENLISASWILCSRFNLTVMMRRRVRMLRFDQHVGIHLRILVHLRGNLTCV